MQLIFCRQQLALGEITEANVKASAGLTKTKDVDGVSKARSRRKNFRS